MPDMSKMTYTDDVLQINRSYIIKYYLWNL